MPLAAQHPLPRRAAFGGQHEQGGRWNDPPSHALVAGSGAQRRRDAKVKFAVSSRPAAVDAAGRQQLRIEDIGVSMRGGPVGLRTNVQYREGEASVQELLPLRREARDAAKRAEALRDGVVKSKIALVKTRVALEKRVMQAQGGRDGVQLAAMRPGAERGGELLETGDHLKFEMMLGKVCEVDEEVTALRKSVLSSEREARQLRVQKNKLDRLAAALKSQRLLNEVLNPEVESGVEGLSDQMKTLLKATSRLRSLIDVQGDTDPGQMVPHAAEFAASGIEREASGRGGGSTDVVRLERTILLEKVKALEERVTKFDRLLACDTFFGEEDMARLVRDYVLEESCFIYRLEVRTSAAVGAGCDSEAYVSVAGEYGCTDRELLYNADYPDQTFPRGSTRFFEIRSLENLGKLRSVTVWVGGTGDAVDWLLEDISVIDMRSGRAAVFPCGFTFRQKAFLTLDAPVEGCYCVYEIAVRAPPDALTPIPDELDLVLVGMNGEGEEESAVRLDDSGRVHDETDEQLALFRSRHLSRKAQQQEPHGGDAVGAEQRVEKRWRVRARYVGGLVRLSVMGMVPNNKWDLDSIEVMCCRTLRRHSFTHRGGTLNPLVAFGEAKDNVGGQTSIVCIAADGRGRSGAGEKSAGEGPGMQRDLEVMSRQLEAVPSFELPVAITETFADLLMARERELKLSYALLRDRVADLELMLSSGVALRLEVGQAVWSYYTLGEAARKSAYVQRGVVQLLPPDLSSEARMYGGKVCEEPVVGVNFAGVSQVVPLSWIVDKVDAQVGLTDAAEQIERILAPLKQKIQSVLAQKGGQGAGFERRALAMAVGTEQVDSTSPRASAAGQGLDSGGLAGTEPIALQAENATLKQRVLVAEQEARDALEREKSAEARSKHTERLRREVDELNASLEQRIDLEQQTREALVTSKEEELSGLKERTEELEEACAKANALVRNLEQRMRDKDDEILALMQQVAARRVDAGQGDATGPGDVPFASDGDVGLEAENDAVGEGVAEGIVEPSGEQRRQDQAQGNGETAVVVAALEQEMARLREEMGKCQAVCVSQKTRIDDLQALLDESEHQRVALQLSLDSTHVLQAKLEQGLSINLQQTLERGLQDGDIQSLMHRVQALEEGGNESAGAGLTKLLERIALVLEKSPAVAAADEGGAREAELARQHRQWAEEREALTRQIHLLQTAPAPHAGGHDAALGQGDAGLLQGLQDELGQVAARLAALERARADLSVTPPLMSTHVTTQNESETPATAGGGEQTTAISPLQDGSSQDHAFTTEGPDVAQRSVDEVGAHTVAAEAATAEDLPPSVSSGAAQDTSGDNCGQAEVAEEMAVAVHEPPQEESAAAVCDKSALVVDEEARSAGLLPLEPDPSEASVLAAPSCPAAADAEVMGEEEEEEEARSAGLLPPDDGVVVSDEDEPEDKADDLGEDAEEVGSVGKIAPETDVLQSTGAGVQEAEEGQEDAGSELESSVGSKNQEVHRGRKTRVEEVAVEEEGGSDVASSGSERSSVRQVVADAGDNEPVRERKTVMEEVAVSEDGGSDVVSGSEASKDSRDRKQGQSDELLEAMLLGDEPGETGGELQLRERKTAMQEVDVEEEGGSDVLSSDGNA